MKLLQLNAWGARLGHQVADLLKEQSPDIACLQEVIEFEGDAVLCASLGDLQESGAFKESFHSPVFSFNMTNKPAHFGNAILSLAPATKTETIFTNLEYKADFSFESDDYNIRNLQHAVFEHAGTTLHILNHHGHHVRTHKNGNEETIRQMRQIADYLQTLDGAVILAGDFNLAPHSKSLEIINELLENQSVKHELSTTRTPLTSKTEVCDYIFTSSSIRVQDFRMLDTVVSDHAALLLDFELTQPD